jgi:hypothetical protein
VESRLTLAAQRFCLGAVCPGLVVLSSSILFDQRQEVAGRVFEPCNDRSAAPRANPFGIGLKIRLAIMLETNSALSEFLDRILDVLRREVKNGETSGRVFRPRLQQNVGTATGIETQQ